MGGCEDAGASPFKLLRLLRTLRLVKLVRLVKASRIIKRLDPNGDGDLDIGEFKEGIKRSKETPAALRFAQRAGRIVRLRRA